MRAPASIRSTIPPQPTPSAPRADAGASAETSCRSRVTRSAPLATRLPRVPLLRRAHSPAFFYPVGATIAMKRDPAPQPWHGRAQRERRLAAIFENTTLPGAPGQQGDCPKTLGALQVALQNAVGSRKTPSVSRRPIYPCAPPFRGNAAVLSTRERGADYGPRFETYYRSARHTSTAC